MGGATVYESVMEADENWYSVAAVSEQKDGQVGSYQLTGFLQLKDGFQIWLLNP